MNQLLLPLQSRSRSARKLVTVKLSPVNAAEPIRRLAIALRAARQRINQAIAEEIAKITRSNFGPAGIDRPAPWPPYSKRYAKKHPGPPTLVSSGALLSSIRASATNQGGTVTAEGSRNYAGAQQFGYSRTHLPARPYFPIYARSGGSAVLTPHALARIQTVYENEVKRVLGIR